MNKAVNLFSAAADQGDPRAQFELGKLYQYPPMVVGSPIKKDIDVAIKLYRLAADQDYSYGIFMLGYIYSRNIKATDDPAGPVDDEKAAELYTKASDRGLPIATAYLARAYLQGNGVRRDRKYALGLLEKAAEEGVGKAFNLLGKLYDLKKTSRFWSVKDLNIEKDLQKSYKMYQAAADRGINFAASAASRKKLEIERIKGEALREEQLDALGSTPTGPAIFVQADTQYWDCKSAIGDLILDDLYDVVRGLAIRTDIPQPDSDACSYSVKADHDTGDDSKRVRINWYTSPDNMETCLRETCATKYTASFGVWGAHIGFESIYASIQVFQPILTGVGKRK
jgi:TPR repeat protein